MNDRDVLRELLYGVRSHVHALHALEGLDPRSAGAGVPGSPHTIHQILGHMIFWQGQALERMRGGSPPYPASAAGGWPFPPGPEGDDGWEAAVAAFAEGLRSVETLVLDPDFDLDRRPHPDRDRTAREEVLMVQQHNSHHLGQIILLRRQLDAWPPPRGGDTW